MSDLVRLAQSEKGRRDPASLEAIEKGGTGLAEISTGKTFSRRVFVKGIAAAIGLAMIKGYGAGYGSYGLSLGQGDEFERSLRYLEHLITLIRVQPDLTKELSSEAIKYIENEMGLTMEDVRQIRTVIIPWELEEAMGKSALASYNIEFDVEEKIQLIRQKYKPEQRERVIAMVKSYRTAVYGEQETVMVLSGVNVHPQLKDSCIIHELTHHKKWGEDLAEGREFQDVNSGQEYIDSEHEQQSYSNQIRYLVRLGWSFEQFGKAILRPVYGLMSIEKEQAVFEYWITTPVGRGLEKLWQEVSEDVRRQTRFPDPAGRRASSRDKLFAPALAIAGFSAVQGGVPLITVVSGGILFAGAVAFIWVLVQAVQKFAQWQKAYRHDRRARWILMPGVLLLAYIFHIISQKFVNASGSSSRAG